MANKYKVGTISKILAKSSDGGRTEVDPKLAALFGGASANSSPKVFKTVKVSSEVFDKAPPNTDHSSTKVGKKAKKNKLQDSVIDKSSPVQDTPVKKRKRLDKAQSPIPSSEPEQLKKKKKKKKKLKVESGDSNLDKDEDTSIKSSTGNRKEKLKKKKLKGKIKKEGKKKPVQSIVEADIKSEPEEELQEDDDEDEDGKKAAEESTVARKSVAEMNAPKPKDDELEARTVFIGNLSKDTTPKAIKKIFVKFGKVETVRFRCAAVNKPTAQKKVAIIKKEFHPDNETVAAYVRFSTVEEAEKAAGGAQGMVLQDHHLTVDIANAKGKSKDNKKAIFVGNLHFKLTDEELWRFFEDCGKIASVRIVRDNVTGIGKGFGYVNFEEKDAIDVALSTKNQKELKNRLLRIKRCVKKPKIKSMVTKGGQSPMPAVKLENSPKAIVKKEKKKERWSVDGQRRQRPSRVAKEAAYSGDKLAEIGKLKRKSKKPNRGELRKANIARLLTSGPNKRKTFK